MNSPWGHFGGILERFGWTYDYLLWGISWINVELIMEDALRVIDNDQDNPDGGKIERKELKTKEDIKNYIKGIM
jgi:hypothetical protein